VGATGGYALDEALGEGRDARVIVLVRVRVSYASAKAGPGRGGEDALSTPARKLIAESNAAPNRRVLQAFYSWAGRITTVRVRVLIPVSPAPTPSILKTTHLHLLLRNPTRLAHPNRERTRQRPAPQPPLLPTTADNGLETYPWSAPYKRCADALGSIHLMPAEAYQVDVHRLYVEWDLAQSLRGVGVEVDTAVLFDQLADLLQRLDDTCLVVHGHDGHQDRLLWPDGGFECGEGDEAVSLHGEVGDFEPFFGELAA